MIVIDNEMVERAADVLWTDGAVDPSQLTNWRDRFPPHMHDRLLALARRALTAALGEKVE